MNSSDQDSNKFLMMWDIYGIECLFDLSNWEQETVWAKLKEEKLPDAPNLNLMILRAKFNMQRKYEIYIISCEESLDFNFWKEQWETNPQFTAELVREKGQKIYSDYSQDNRQKVF
jgi:hypothetical protein